MNIKASSGSQALAAMSRGPHHALIPQPHSWSFAWIRGPKVLSGLLGMLLCSTTVSLAADLNPVVEIEEDVYSYTNANNGAGPMWCHGSTSLVRAGAEVFASGLETMTAEKPLNNCRWVLFHRGARGWERVREDEGRTREPSPMAAFQDGRVILSANPTLGNAPQPNGGPASPRLFQFSSASLSNPPVEIVPEWQGKPRFTEHSYRSLAADGAAGELVLFQNIDYTHAEWAFRDRAGRWSAQGQLKWPWGADYPKPQPIRVCYPNVALRDRAVHFLGVSDIMEPRPDWQEFKYKLTGQHWDYDFRRLFYTWTQDITQKPFVEWIEIASREKTGGGVAPGDLWLAPDGEVHILWTERAIDERLRAQFFPEAKQAHLLNYAVLRDGKIARRTTLAESTEAKPGIVASQPRFHVTPDRRLFAVFYAGGVDAAGKGVAENRMLELRSDGSVGSPKRIPLAKPFTSYFTATVRGGSAPSETLEMLGQRPGSPNAISYAKIRLF